MRKYHFTLLFILILSSINAQNEVYSFRLQEAIDYALENNRIVKNAQRDIEAAEKQKWETIATGLPQVDANINYQNFLKQQVSVIPAEFIPGGEPGDFVEVIFGTQHNVNATATLNQLIFDGSYIVGLQSVKVFLEISQKAKTKTDLEVREAVINAYGNVLLAEETEQILTRNRDVLEDNLNETSKIYENGLTDEESVEQLQITLASIESALKNATRLKFIAYQMFNITLGIDLNLPVEFTDNLQDLTDENVDLVLLEAEDNVSNNIDFQIAENEKLSQELLVKLEKSKALPTLSAFLNGGYQSFGNEFTFFESGNSWNGFSTLGLNINIPIFSSLGRTARTQRAKIDLEKAEENLLEIEQQLSLQIATAKSNYQFSIEDYEIKKENLRLAERIETKTETKFFEGIGTSFELRQAQIQLYTAQEDYLRSMLAVINNKTELETVLNLPNQ
ncbi:MAG: TolC family protein [Bacteroidota bacterium]